MKLIMMVAVLFFTQILFAQGGQVWSVDTKQEMDVDENLEVTKTYDLQYVCQFFMFINNNEFIHVTDGITSLYKILKRDLSDPNQPIYTVMSEAGNTYAYGFNTELNLVTVYSAKGYLIEFACLSRHQTEVFKNLDK